MSIHDFLTLIFKYKVRIVVIFVTVVGFVLGGLLLSKPVYEAKSTLLIKPWKEDAPRPGMGGEAPGTNSYLTLSQEELVNTEIQILTGRDLAEKIIDALTLKAMYPGIARSDLRPANQKAAAVLAFSKSLKIVAVRKSNVITVTFQHPNAKIAAQALNLLIDAFKEKHLALHSAPESSFISTQLNTFEKKLKDSEKELQTYQQANNVFSLEEQRTLLLKQRSDLDTSYKLARNAIGELKNKIAATKGQLSYISKNSAAHYTPTERDKVVTDAKTKQLELQLKEQELRRKYAPTNQLVVEAKKEVDLVSQFVKEQEAALTGKVKTGNPVYQSMEIDLFRAEGELNSQIARAESLNSQIKAVDKEIASLDLSEDKVQNLKRAIAINEKNYKIYADRQEEANISETMNKLKLSNISVIQGAEAPAQPVALNRMFKLIMGVLVGAFSGLACAYLSESWAQTFSDPESVERYLELPVLLTVPRKED